MENIISDGRVYISPEMRSGEKSDVFFTRELSPDALCRMFDRVGKRLNGKIAVKLHTGERGGPNIIPSSWVKTLFAEKLKNASIVETNTYYEGDRDTNEKHRETLKINGWDFCPVDILDEEGNTFFKITNGKWFKEMSVGKNLENYDSLLVLTHFKGHIMGGFGGSNKNIGIGCADGKVGKKMIHSYDGNPDMWAVNNEEFMEKMTESAKSVTDRFGENIVYINVMRNMSVSCDCEGKAAMPVVTPNVGILASTDILAVDSACIDLIYAMKPEENKAFKERVETRHGHRQLSYMNELKMGNSLYNLIDTDNEDAVISPSEAVKNLTPFKG